MKHQSDLLGFFAHHKVAANLLMIMMILGGLFALHKLTVRYFPNFDLDVITVSVVWNGASAEDVETAITIPLEQNLKSIDNLHKMTSTSTQGLATITLELVEGTDTIDALNQAKQKVDEFRNLPADAEEPSVINVARYEQVARILLYGPAEPAELRILSNRFEQELLDSGIDKVDVAGLPEQEIAIQINHNDLQQLGISLDQVGQRIQQLSQDIPAGTFGEADNATELRSLDQRRSELGFHSLPIISDSTSRINLGDIAVIKRQDEKGGVTLSVDGKPAVELVIRSSDYGDAFESAEIFQRWLQQTRQGLPPGVNLYVYDQSWRLIKDRISLLLKNGGGGLLLVVAILYLFLSTRVALWVAVGIPVSFMATLLILYGVGGSINMISLFALIMALGIIVDDAIVVGEDALAHYQAGEQPLMAAEGGARRMRAPVIASSLTTIAAFIPLMLIGGPIGNILFDIPLIIVAVIIASVMESFFVLPGHLRHSFVHMARIEQESWHKRFNDHFEHVKNVYFKKLVKLTLHHRAIALSLVIALLITALGLLAGKRLKFHFFPSPESAILYVNAGFVPGTPKQQVDRFLSHLRQTLTETDQALSAQALVLKAISRHGGSLSNKGRAAHSGDHLASMILELEEPDRRTVRNNDFIKAWKQRIRKPAGLDVFTITSRSVGPPGRDLSVRLTGNTPEILKQAALEFAQTIRSIPGVSDIEDDMPYGRNQLVYKLTPAGEALGLTVADLGRQLRTAFEGRLIQLFQDGLDEVEVRVKLPEQQRQSLNALNQLEIRLANGNSVLLSNVAEWRSKRGFEILRHAEGKLAVEISAEIDSKINNAELIIDSLRQTLMPQLASRYDIQYSFEGRSADQAETMADMRYGLIIGLTLIYLVLAWVFASYGWPLVVMSAIPFGLIGALFGHLFMGIDLTILSLFGFFGLSGIVINDSIILVNFYQHLIQQGMSTHDALVEASCRRLRAVLLTSLTTIAGLAPLLFETSLQAQFLIPMATAIAFGLIFSTVLVLLVIPVLLSYHEDLHGFFVRYKEKLL
ncbi:efflux RND transporter permease subunit [Methylomarinum sp. Ch1-1]|uniref:Efflux RND transporter permease subunit n=1 Tax=Methylomarinum roseum TaxID=3067653 RepID=A0AAU7NUC3_9GAMM|nr:efflux RND transporter permease subunit [Methylomarinum sp. Ch1-1]MDP4519332.1 efflux RND transporter permease subunit [Methylomarinum sp. Ch1-1]